ncbi:MAG: hypothetical protein V4642_07030 [Bacteroidota bacterium]
MKYFHILAFALVLLNSCKDDNPVDTSGDKAQYIYFLTDTLNIKSRETETYYARMDTNGTNRKYLMRLWYGPEKATYSPDGKKVVLDHRTVMNINGTDRRFFADANGFAWSPNSSYVAHWSYDSLKVTDVNTLETKLVAAEKYFSKAVWAHDSKTLYYTKRDSSITSIRADGSERKILLKAVLGSEIDLIADITASPREDIILFTHRNAITGKAEIGVIKADGSGRRVTNDAGGFIFHNWSPDGRRVLAVKYIGKTQELCEIDVQSLSIRSYLQFTEKDILASSYSPDGTKILFTLSEKLYQYGLSYSRIFIMNNNGSQLRSLTSDTLTESTPPERYAGWSK